MRRFDNAITPWRVQLGVALLTIAFVGGMGYVLVTGNSIQAIHEPQEHAAQEILATTTYAHLWFEEVVSGDPHETIATVWDLLDKADRLARAMLYGGPSAVGDLVALNDTYLRQRITEVQVRLHEFRTLAEERLTQPTNAGPGSDLDERFDKVFGALIDDLQTVESYLKEIVADQLIAFRRTQMVLVAVGLAIAATVSALFHGYHRRIIHHMASLVQTERDLHAYADELERSNRELGDFAFAASHDLREPLRKVQAFGDRLAIQEQARLSEQGLDYLQRMRGAAARMERQIDALLAYSRVGTLGGSFQAADLYQIAHEALVDLEIPLRRNGGRVVIEPLPTVDADHAQMRQLFQNLIGNGLKFHAPGVAPEVRVAGVVHGDACEITVADNGIGFEERFSDRIFGVFQRLHGRQDYDGTGVGLAICKKIAERHGGTITARSALGEGSTFIVTLPTHQSNGSPHE